MHDVRLAFRGLRASPILSTAAVLSLALGIGANTAIFSVVDALLLRPLPVASPERLVTVSSGFALNHGFKAGAGMNYEMWTRMNERAAMFDGGFAWAPARVDLSQGGETQPADALFASGGFFGTLGVPALLGRTFTTRRRRERRRPGRAGHGHQLSGLAAAVRRRRGRDWEGAAGRRRPLHDRRRDAARSSSASRSASPSTSCCRLPSSRTFAAPRASLHHPAALMLTAMFRLKPGQSIESATAALRAMQPDILGLSGQSAPRNLPAFLKDPYVLVPAAAGTSDRSGLRRQYTRPLLTMGGVVVLVLLVACVNIANLLLIRGADRAHEMSVRLALGASRWRLARQLLIESLLLAGMGAAVGLAFAAWASRIVVSSLSTPDTRVSLNLPLDWRVLAVTASLAILTALLFGIGPALRASGAAPIEALRQGGRGGSGRGRSGSLVVVQVALSLVLLAAAGLFLSTFRRLATLPLGFEAGRVLVVDVDTARAHTDQASRLRLLPAARRHDRVSARRCGSRGVDDHPIQSGHEVPGVRRPESRSRARRLAGILCHLRDDDRRGAGLRHQRLVRQPARGDRQRVVRREVPAGPESAGRDARLRAMPASTRTLCRRRRRRRRGVRRPALRSTADNLSAARAIRQISVPPGRTVIAISVRPATVRPALLAATIADALTKVNGRLSFSYRPLEQDVAAALTQERLLAALSGFFAGLALLLAALGLYGVTAYSAARRRTEIGIRMALGATPLRVVGLVLTRALLFTAAGIVAGVGLSAWTSRFIATLLFGVQPQDATTMALAAVSLAAVATLASGIPAIRAALVNPARALRET